MEGYFNRSIQIYNEIGKSSHRRFSLESINSKQALADLIFINNLLETLKNDEEKLFFFEGEECEFVFGTEDLEFEYDSNTNTMIFVASVESAIFELEKKKEILQIMFCN